MRASAMLVGGAILFSGLVGGYGAVAWVRTEAQALDAAEAEGRALLQAVAAGIESSLAAGHAVDGLLAERLFELAGRLEQRLARSAAAEGVLREFVAANDLRGAALLDDELAVVASAAARPAVARPGTRPAADAGPFGTARLDRLEAASLSRRAREAGLAGQDRAVFGFGDNPFGVRTEFLVGIRLRRGDGYLVLRRDAHELRRFRETAGVRRLLSAAADNPAIEYVVVQAVDGVVLAADNVDREGESLPDARGVPTWRETSDGRRVLDLSLPAPWKGPPAGSLRVGLAAGPVETLIQSTRRDVVVFTITTLLAGLVGLVLLALRERRGREREAALRRDLETRERFAALGRLAGGVAHEIRSPLNVLGMAAQRLEREVAPAEGPERASFLELTGALRGAVARLDRTVEEFLGLGRRQPPPSVVEVDVAKLVHDVIEAESVTGHLLPPDEPVRARVDRDLVARTLANLVRNAGQIAPGEPVTVAWRRDEHGVLLEVTDHGPGIPVEDRDRIFEPFWTGRRGGTGLGLTLAKEGVERHGGTLTVRPGPTGGTIFAMRLPDA